MGLLNDTKCYNIHPDLDIFCTLPKQHEGLHLGKDENEKIFAWPTAHKKESTNREFDTGATRDSDTDKLDYEGFLSPIVLESFAQYMHKNRTMRDGTVRDSDNWQLGIPQDAYIKSLFRHFMDLWLMHRKYETDADIKETLNAILFNTQGYLHELLKNER